MFKRITVLMFVTLLATGLVATPAVQAQTTWYVDDDAPNDPGPGDPNVSDPDEDGSADHPFDAIQEGINAATHGDTVLVLDGTYTGTGNKNLEYDGKAITVRSENGPDTCIIDCQQDGRGFYFHSGETGASVVEDFTILNSHESAIECRFAGPTVINCVIVGNWKPGGGAGICCSGGANATILDCTFTNNLAEWGGAISCEGSEVTISGCTMTGNWSDVGGAIYLLGSSGTIANCAITGNQAGGYGGGVYCDEGCSPTIANCTISGNLADWGAGIYCWGPDTDPTVANCIIAGNAARFWGGGVVLAGDVDPTMVNCTITGNSADLCAGGLHCLWGSSPRIANCIFWNDTPEEVCLEDGNPLISYCDVQGGWPGQGNIESDPLFLGGPSGTWTADGSYDAQTFHVTFTDAGAVWGEGELVGKFVNPDAAQSLQLIIVGNTGTTITGWADWWTIYTGASWVTTGMSYQIHDYHLTGGASPCIDAADNEAVPADELDLDEDNDTDEPIPFDLDGNPRFLDDPGTDDTGNPDPDYPDLPIVDMGAYEFQVACPGDIDGDGDTDHADLGALLGAWDSVPGDPHWNPDADLDGDGHIGHGDLGIFLPDWGCGT